jgi:hypothetical protein
MERIQPGRHPAAPKRQKYVDRIGKFWNEPPEEDLGAPPSASRQAEDAELSDGTKPSVKGHCPTPVRHSDEEPAPKVAGDRGQRQGFKIRFPLVSLAMLQRTVVNLQRYARLQSLEEAEGELARLLGVRTYQDAARILTSRHVFLGPGQWTKAPPGSVFGGRPALAQAATEARLPDEGSTRQAPRRATGVRRHEVIEGMRAEARQIETLRGLAPAKALLEVARDYGFNNFEHALQLFPECEVIDEPERSEPSPRRHHLPKKKS